MPDPTPVSLDSDQQATNPFPAGVIAAVMDHMNTDHEGDSLLICRSLGGRPAATSAEMTGMDGDAIVFSAIVDGTAVPVRVPWSRPLTERSEVRPEVTRMYYAACDALGVAARPPVEH